MGRMHGSFLEIEDAAVLPYPVNGPQKQDISRLLRLTANGLEYALPIARHSESSPGRSWGVCCKPSRDCKMTLGDAIPVNILFP